MRYERELAITIGYYWLIQIIKNAQRRGVLKWGWENIWGWDLGMGRVEVEVGGWGDPVRMSFNYEFQNFEL